MAAEGRTRVLQDAEAAAFTMGTTEYVKYQNGDG